MTLYPPTFRDLTFSEFSWFAKTKQLTGSTHQSLITYKQSRKPCNIIAAVSDGTLKWVSILSSLSTAPWLLASAETAVKGCGGADRGRLGRGVRSRSRLPSPDAGLWSGAWGSGSPLDRVPMSWTLGQSLLLGAWCRLGPKTTWFQDSSSKSAGSSTTWKYKYFSLLKTLKKGGLPIKPTCEGHYFTSVWDECNCAVVWAFFGIAFLWDWNENWPFPVLWPLSFPNLLAYWVQHFHSIIFQDLK